MQSFRKKNTTQYPDALVVEYKGLLQLQKLLEQCDEIQTPNILEFSQELLELEYIESVIPSASQMQQLGIGLAKMHKNKFVQYGLSYNNYIGLNPQENGVSQNWGAFFVEKRLHTQISWIEEKELQEEFLRVLKRHEVKLITFLNDTTQHSSLVHGDLWNGNVLFSAANIYLIDPAIYFGDREVDIAMTEMFGGFSSAFYEAYNTIYPLSESYTTKKEIYNLYHYLNHYNLFGNSYLADCKERFVMIESL